MPTVAQGKIGDLVAICSVHPARIDFNLMPPTETSEFVATSLDLIENTSLLHAELMRIIEIIRNGDASYSVSRVALFAQFLQLRENITEANNTLTNAIPDQYRMQIADEEDFIFQINRPKMSRQVDNVKMNFITKWSVERIQILSLAMPMMVGSPIPVSAGMPPSQQQQFVAASVTFDNNNVPTATPLTGNQQSALLLEGLTAVAEMQRSNGLNIEGF